MNKTFQSLLAILLLLSLAACNRPQSASGAPTINATQAYQTVEARLTQEAVKTPSPQPATPTTQAPTATSTQPGTATATSRPPSSPTTVSKQCDQAALGVPVDVTIPDGTQMQPGETFTKIWRLQNAGTCTWTKKYSIAVFSGEPMQAPDSVPLPQEVAPGESVDISVDLVAPTNPNTYQSDWKLRNESGTWFGIGPGASTFWVNIVVAGTPVGTITPSLTPGTPVPTREVTESILANGSGRLLASDHLDLDNGQMNAGAGEDVVFEETSEGLFFLTPISGARMAPMGSSQPALTACQATALSEVEMPLESLYAGLYLCYRTDQGFFGWMRLIKFNADNKALTVEFLTWANP